MHAHFSLQAKQRATYCTSYLCVSCHCAYKRIFYASKLLYIHQMFLVKKACTVETTGVYRNRSDSEMKPLIQSRCVWITEAHTAYGLTLLIIMLPS